MAARRRAKAAYTYIVPDAPAGQSSGTSSIIHQYTDSHSDGRISRSATTRRVPNISAEHPVLVPDAASPDLSQPSDYLAYEVNLADYAREMRESDDPLRQWVSEHRDRFLSELLRLEGRGDHRYSNCSNCGVRSATFRCRDCFSGGSLQCSECLLKTHQHLPFHRPEEWNGVHFESRTLKGLGLRVQLGHWDDPAHTCPQPHRASGDDFLVIDTNGIHEVGLDFCGCFRNGPPTEQLLRAGIYPATTTNPRTGATLHVLRHFHLSFLESKCSTYDYYYSLARQTDNTGLMGVRDRYDEFLRMTKEWRNLQMLKRTGRGHDPAGAAATQPGECALLCPACPQPGKNLPDDWQEYPKEKQFLFALFLAIDANFRLKRKDVSSEKKDPGLVNGWAFYCDVEKYMAHVKKHWNDKQARSRCVAHDAVDKPDREARGTASSGIGAVDCARHNMKRPLSVGDLQLGERYINMDFMFFRSINGSDLICFFVSYDIACQWNVHLWDRMSKYDNEILSINENNKYFVFLVPKFHLPAHIEECNIRFSFNLTRFVGMTDGEAPERGWSATNPLAGSTMNMGPGSRRDALDDFFNDQNHKKIISLGKTMLDKVKNTAPLVIETRQAQVDLESGFSAQTIVLWTEMVERWEAGATTRPNPFPNPFESSGKATFLAGVRHKLAEEAAAREAAGEEVVGAVRDDTVHVTELLAGGLQLEEQQRTLAADMAAMGLHPSDQQRTNMVERASKLRRKILAWADIQAQFFPIVERLRQQDNDARAHLAASHSQAIPGVGVAEIKLWLPSALRRRPGTNESNADGCTWEILTYEYRLRIGQANEALNTIRRNLLVRTHLYNQKDRYARGVKANTRSNTKIKTVDERVRRAVALYLAAWSALETLGKELGMMEWKAVLRELKADDVRGIPRAHFGDAARQRGASSSQIEADTLAPLDGTSIGESSRRKRQRSGGSGPAGLSWIWIQQAESRKEGDPEEADEALRIEWARTRARALRWAEELDLLEEEMRRVVQFLSWRASWWENRLLLKQSESPTASDGYSGEAVREEADVQREGEAAYARRQSQLQRDLRDAFKRQWEPLPAYIAEARERVKLLTPNEDADVATAGNVGDIGDDADAPVPLGAPGAVVATEVDEPL
ncbi:hypothetical protein C8F01DRAFT_1370735 [Mycena amicta]|nr:hypothetical protein C8F01DRAFT_1370735 [Mycena amicta]